MRWSWLAALAVWFQLASLAAFVAGQLVVAYAVVNAAVVCHCAQLIHLRRKACRADAR